MSIPSWFNNTSPCVWNNATSNFTIGGPLTSNASTTTTVAGGANETRAIHITIEVEPGANMTGGGGGNASTGGSTMVWQGLWVMQRCEAEEDHW